MSIYPGDAATPLVLKLLADEYRQAALFLIERVGKRKPLSRAPARMTAIHAIELYLSAYLLRSGYTHVQIRGLQHDFERRAEQASASGLRLRKRTVEHIKSLNGTREYIATRYAPELAKSWSQLNRLTATLEEVATKVSTSIASDERSAKL